MFISYSLFYTFLPILAVGMFEQPVRAETALAYPKAYIVSQQVTPTLSPPHTTPHHPITPHLPSGQALQPGDARAVGARAHPLYLSHGQAKGFLVNPLQN